ncbi:MAG: ATP-binding protein [Armatimonadota bacterium]
MRRAVSVFGETLGIDELDLGDLVAAVGEAFANAVEHGSGNTAITVVLTAEDSRVVVDLEYGGEPFPVHTVSTPEPGQLRDGGLGRYIMQELMDDVAYKFSDGITRLRMLKRLRPEPTAVEEAQATYTPARRSSTSSGTDLPEG